MSSTPFGQKLPDLVTPVPGPASRQLATRLAGVESHNVTDLRDPGPIFWARAQGANVRDVDGNDFIDLSGAFGVAAVGHARPEVTQAIASQAEMLLHGMGDIHPSAIKVELLEALAAWAPWPDTKSILATSGSEAVEAGLKTAQLATGRPGLLAFEGAYHGLTLGSLAVTHRAHFRAPFAQRTYAGVHFTPFPNTPEEAGASLQAVRSILSEHGQIGAVIIEPIQGRAGVRVPPPGFLAALAEVTRAAGALLVADEIFTGFGRTGAAFASVADGCEPDLICAGKALGGGMPLSVCMGPASVMDSWPESSGEAIHTSTFLGHPAACAAALATLDTLSSDGLIERAAAAGGRWIAALAAALSSSPNVEEVRGRGMMIGIELSRTGQAVLGGGPQVATRLLEKGLLLLPAGGEGEVLELTPPLVITPAQMDHATGAIAEMLV